MPPRLASARRAVPYDLSDPQRERLRYLLECGDVWVLRPGWTQYLLEGDDSTLIDPAELSADHRVAALAWLQQQRHALHREIVGELVAPPGWLEAFPLYKRLKG